MNMTRNLLSISVLTITLMASAGAQGGAFSSSTEEIKVNASTNVENNKWDTQEIEATLLSTPFKSDGRKYLYEIDFSSECEIRRFSIGPRSGDDNYSELGAAVRIWATVDGEIVAVANNEAAERDNIVILCSQLEWDEASRGNRDDLITSSGFTWMVTNLPKGNHQLEIKAALYASAKSGPQAANGVKASVGKRLLKVNRFR